jgi:hypothetical protein
MKRFTHAVTLSAMFLSGASALAQEAAPAAVPQTATAAPQSNAAPGSTSSGSISTLNGELVPVGDHNRFQYDFKRFNASTNPIGWMIGRYGLSLAYAPTNIVAVRGDVSYYNWEGDHGVDVALAAPIYFRKMYSGFFLEPALTFKALSSDFNGGTESATVVGPQMSAGWHWYWDSGLNVQLSLGIGRNWNSNDSDAFDARYNEIFPTGALRFGYAF